MEEIVYSNIQTKGACCWILTFEPAPLFDTSGCTVSGFHRDYPGSPYVYWDILQQCFTNQKCCLIMFHNQLLGSQCNVFDELVQDGGLVLVDSFFV